MRDLLEIVGYIEKSGASLRILAMNLDTGTPTGKLMLNVLGSVAQFEREMMLERQREGIAKAKAKGKYRGRAPTAKAKANEIKVLAKPVSGRRRSRDGWMWAGQASIGRSAIAPERGPPNARMLPCTAPRLRPFSRDEVALRPRTNLGGIGVGPPFQPPKCKKGAGPGGDQRPCAKVLGALPRGSGRGALSSRHPLSRHIAKCHGIGVSTSCFEQLIRCFDQYRLTGCPFGTCAV